MDSAISYCHTLHRAEGDPSLRPVHAIAFQYGQRHQQETSYAERICTAQRRLFDDSICGNYMLIPLRGHPLVGSLLSSTRVRKYERITDIAGDDPSFIPHRNLLFLTIACMWARKWGAHEVITGVRGGFPDCTEHFERTVEAVMWASDPDWLITISSPLHRSRQDSVALAQELKCLDILAYTMTCFEGTEPPCGHCLPCLRRAEGFAHADIPDPLLTRLRKT